MSPPCSSALRATRIAPTVPVSIRDWTLRATPWQSWTDPPAALRDALETLEAQGRRRSKLGRQRRDDCCPGRGDEFAIDAADPFPLAALGHANLTSN